MTNETIRALAAKDEREVMTDETIRELPPEVMDAFDVIARACLLARRPKRAEQDADAVGAEQVRAATRAALREAYAAGQADLMVRVAQFWRPCDVEATLQQTGKA